MTLALVAGVPLAVLTAMYLYERRGPAPSRARAARCTVENALRRTRVR